MGGTIEHISMWVLAIILFLVSFTLKGKSLKVVMMINRVLYLMIIITGIMLLMSLSSISGEYIGKAIIGLWVIVSMEMVSVKRSKEKGYKSFFVQFWIALVLVLALGFRLPLGMDFF